MLFFITDEARARGKSSLEKIIGGGAGMSSRADKARARGKSSLESVHLLSLALS
jgi:hypothetical protein